MSEGVKYDAGKLRWSLVPEGVMDDPETGMPHLAHAMCCITFLMWLEAEANKEF